jgi:hypothetical protein
MTATEEPTLYDVLEVAPEASLDELRAAVERARETYGPESVAVYALVGEEQLDEVRARLDEAAAVLLDPARRATYDRSIGRPGTSMLWAEDDDDEAPLPPIEPGPHARAAPLELEPALDEAEDEPPPRQHALALDLSDGPGPFGRGPEEAGTASRARPPAATEDPAPAPLLSGDWAEAVPAVPVEAPGASALPAAEVEAIDPAATDQLPPPARALPPAEQEAPELAAEEVSSSPSGGLPPSLGLRVKSGMPPAPPDVPATVPPPPPAPIPVAAMPEQLPELPARRDGRIRLDIPSDAEFNGELLRRVRESYGLSLQQVAERTRITRIHLENVEADRYDRLPATVYLRGILVNLARELRLDPARVSKTYLLAAQRAHGRAF